MSITSSIQSISDCFNTEIYFKTFFPEINLTFGFSTLLFIWMTILQFNAHLLANFPDLLIILLSIGIAQLFKRINSVLNNVKHQSLEPSFWSEHHHMFKKTCELLARADEAISMLVMVSLSRNLFFICADLLDVRRSQIRSLSNLTFYWYSLIYLILRTFFVYICASEINDESKKSVEVFRAVPRASWCIEIKRFNDDVSCDIIALSGWKFFYITREIVLKVCGSIITYELVLLQFSDEFSTINDDPCANSTFNI